MRKCIDINTDTTKKYAKLTQKELAILVTCSSILCSLGSNNHSFAARWPQYLSHAMGVGRNRISSLQSDFIDCDFSTERKERLDKGTSVFNSPTKRKSTFTPYNAFKKAEYKKFRLDPGRIDEKDLKRAYNNLDNDSKHEFDDIVRLDYDQSITLWEELKELLLKTHGRISYRMMATQLKFICCVGTIRNFLKQQEGFQLKTSKVISALTLAQKQKQYDWASTFWDFWRSVTAVPTTKVRYVMLHLDEKWFYAFVSRRNGKILTSIGLESNQIYTRNKSHIDKEMYVVATAFIPHKGNDITKGGKCVPITCICCDELVEAEKDSHKRVYQEDGSHKYPPIKDNQLRVKGQPYFKSLDLTGSSEGTYKKKISLLKCYRDIIIPALEEKIVNKLSEGGKIKVVIVKQEDNAGLHMEKIIYGS